MDRPTTRGGRRPGSGRKPLSDGVRMVQRAISMSLADWDAVDEAAKASDMTRSEFIRNKLSDVLQCDEIKNSCLK